MELLKLLHSHQLRVFTTLDILTLTGMNRPAVTQALCRLKKQQLLSRVKRGVWVNKLIENHNPFEIVPFLRNPWPSYVSLHSALADHGLIEEIPHVIYAVTSASPKNYQTELGEFHIHHLPKHLMWGYEIKQMGQGSFPMADPEKAFLDMVYLALVPRSPIELVHKRGRKWRLNLQRLSEYARKFNFPPLITYLKKNNLFSLYLPRFFI
ncbi:MAG: hypothetical protein HYT97_06690 [Elusimicrobia bacterium]|nr:hypothetical protein [Elusimicrobiota bacterium]